MRVSDLNWSARTSIPGAADGPPARHRHTRRGGPWTDRNRRFRRHRELDGNGRLDGYRGSTGTPDAGAGPWRSHGSAPAPATADRTGGVTASGGQRRGRGTHRRIAALQAPTVALRCPLGLRQGTSGTAPAGSVNLAPGGLEPGAPSVSGGTAERKRAGRWRAGARIVGL